MSLSFSSIFRVVALGASLCIGLTAHADTGKPVLQSSSWELIYWPGHTLPQNAQGKSSVTLGFSAQNGVGRINGYAGCNRFSASYSADQRDKLAVDPLVSTTRMACAAPLMQWETAFLQTLKQVVSYQFVGGSLLELKTKDGKALHFYAHPLPNSPIQVRTVEVAPQKARCADFSPRPVFCLKIRENKNEPWVLWYDEIEGFNFVPGITYRLRVVQTANPNAESIPDQRPSFRTLDQVLEAKEATLKQLQQP